MVAGSGVKVTQILRVSVRLIQGSMKPCLQNSFRADVVTPLVKCQPGKPKDTQHPNTREVETGRPLKLAGLSECPTGKLQGQ